MKHVPLKRKKPMARGKPIKRRRNAAGKPRERFEKLRDEAYRAWIRERWCVIVSHGTTQAKRSHRCWAPSGIVAAHVSPKARGTGDRNQLVPLCEGGHMEQEGHTKAFNTKYGLDLAAIAKELDARYEKECGR